MTKYGAAKKDHVTLLIASSQDIRCAGQRRGELHDEPSTDVYWLNADDVKAWGTNIIASAQAK